MRRPSLRVLACALVAAWATMAGAAGAASTEDLPRYYVAMDPPIVYPGAIVRLQVRAPTDALWGEVHIAGRSFEGEIASGIMSCYFAVDLDTLPGPYRLEYAVAERKGERIVTVRQRRFDSEAYIPDSDPVELSDESLALVDTETDRLSSIWSETTPFRIWRLGFVRPVDGPISAPFGMRRVHNGRSMPPHTGVDILARAGTDVVASNSGRVAAAGELPHLGKIVIVDHGYGLYTYYAHLSEILVQEEQMIARGKPVGRVGRSGEATTVQLHFGARLGGARIDPITLPGIDLQLPPPPPAPATLAGEDADAR